ncbi:hypothetical protein SAICODRAFT_29065 [Saitoella complicata NRRL Y-17804]|uniref:uncharacterized protein n=1 Tax=Saitoella complicata (strain BCRC 22490 / CBS 7301 / JCM 7358 / NBRC 10748 / NRRL Y-17804) TaxID=698492 RepID=UPI0008675EC8|nr:uncharacterized protein SAICODRAFT_29065 [Saitoella complicata NRRL Y-17804]ODQ55503.1 hypothetical protein SAICODRAFT_29065 [Saitoella complicata NRRL Y-17804]
MDAATAKRFDSFHRQVLRWALGLHCSTNNEALYFDSGEIAFSARLVHLTARFYDYARGVSPDRLVHTALMASAVMANCRKPGAGKTWYARLSAACEKIGIALDLSAPPLTGSTNPSRISFARLQQCSHFTSLPLLPSSHTKCLRRQPYLSQSFKVARCIGRLRHSAHKIMNESGRINGSPAEHRFCPHRSADGVAVVETEEHALIGCPRFRNERHAMFDRVRGCLNGGQIVWLGFMMTGVALRLLLRDYWVRFCQLLTLRF